MSSLSSKDRVSLCIFTFSDGRRCRTPRTANHPHFCYYHSRKEAQARTAEKLGNDLAYFFSGDYLSACDLSTALGRLIPAVLRGDLKPRTARTVAYLAQTLLQAIHISQDEYINAFSTDGWRKAIANSVTANYDYRFPPDPDPKQPQPPAATTPPQASSPTNPAVSPESVVAGLQSGSSLPTPASQSLSSASTPRPAAAPLQPSPSSSASTPPQSSPQRTLEPSRVPVGAGLARSDLQPIPATPTLQEKPARSTPLPARQKPSAPAPPPCAPTPQPRTPNRAPCAVHFDHNCRLLIDGKPF